MDAYTYMQYSWVCIDDRSCSSARRLWYFASYPPIRMGNLQVAQQEESLGSAGRREDSDSVIEVGAVNATESVTRGAHSAHKIGDFRSRICIGAALSPQVGLFGRRW